MNIPGISATLENGKVQSIKEMSVISDNINTWKDGMNSLTSPLASAQNAVQSIVDHTNTIQNIVEATSIPDVGNKTI